MNTTPNIQAFIAEHDAQISISIRPSGSPWTRNVTAATLLLRGFNFCSDGRFVMHDESGPLFSLCASEDLSRRITLVLDVPRVSSEKDAFGKMIVCAKSLASQLGGDLVDDADQPLSDAAIATIADQVKSFYSDMAEAGVHAGSPLALRLFARPGLNSDSE